MSRPVQLSTSLTSTPAETPAPLARRAFAFVLDIFLTAILAVVAAVPVQLLWPPDTRIAMAASLVFGLSIAFLYLGLAPSLLGSTLGKWLFSLQLVSRNGGAVSNANLLKRLLATGIWPINGLLVLVRRSRTHLGDSWAKTTVVLADRRRNFWLATAAAVLVAVCGFQAATFASRVAMLRAEVWQEARAMLAKEPGANMPLLPDSYSIVGKVAMFHADSGHGMRRVILVRGEDGWYATDSQPVESTGRRSQVIEASGRINVR